MRYPDSVAKSAEYLRLALPLMTKQRSALHPHSYAVWYEFVSGRNPRLAEALAEQTRDGLGLTEAQTATLYQHHVAQPGLNAQEAQRVSDSLSRVLDNMASSAAHAGDQTARFDQSLLLWSSQLLDAAQDEQAELLQALMAGTREMRAAMAQLQQRLDANQAEIAALRHEVSQARSEALVDALTGLGNRRAFEQQLAQCLSHAHAETAAPCLVLGDIDFFKKVNDSYGHSFGDQVLRAVADSLKSAAPQPHLVTRVGGEEFALLLPASNLLEAQQLAEQLRSKIAASRIRRGAGPTAAPLERVTLSLGVTQLARGESANDFFERADRALYASKRSGRNCVTVLAAKAA
ncbi:GGDEF domain-containing protein [Paucibacter sp. O1-1]|uniref:GGDEF domain-containing protein n=1 Tax=Paucibacter sp. M5-1 TaxID=3015998 RepID=UPI0010F5E7D7|nr:GGDEF domain-containing protein [Paucibacter sp. M5-1]MCU7372624.1 GGDEF domain-containing protein [Paucibacter sp. O1-1]MCZ7882834.1 GGDEF domain-containing protein [Paucibacter sp. M5-1]MDA3827618.1 GGDEF domain-containing protein [Paucibacter sp. O1-1]